MAIDVTSASERTHLPEDAHEHFSTHNDWFDSLWMRVLPRYQSFMLCMVFSTATVDRLTGTLDEITYRMFGHPFTAAFAPLGESLDSPVLWLEAEALETLDPGETEESVRADAAAHQAAHEAAFVQAGFKAPATMRDLAELMISMGIVSRTDNGRWTMPETLPLPEEVLPLPADTDAVLRGIRREHALKPGEGVLLRHLIDELGYPEELFTSLDRLAKATGLDTEGLPAVLDHLVDRGNAHLYRGDPRVEISARSLEAHTRFYLVPDWDHFSEHRVHIVRGD
jgi:hypothetical protein